MYKEKRIMIFGQLLLTIFLTILFFTIFVDQKQ